jgi:hypothetical protein
MFTKWQFQNSYFYKCVRTRAVGTQADANTLQSGGSTAIEYSRAIAPLGHEYILMHYRTYGGPEPPAIDHQGISDSFVGKASVVHYFYAGKWLELTGAD